MLYGILRMKINSKIFQLYCIIHSLYCIIYSKGFNILKNFKMMPMSLIVLRVLLAVSGFALASSPLSRYRMVSIIMEFLTFGE